MALVLANRVQDTTTTTGTGTVTLSGTAPTGYQNFSVIGNGNTTYYAIAAGTEWEVGIGTYATTGPTLARTTVLSSSNANSAVNFSAGTKNVLVTLPTERTAVTTTAGATPTFDTTTLTGTTTASALVDISGASAGQIKFPASQNASANANTLDDYEEGTWTPALTFGGGSTGMTWTLQVGWYTKVGNVVTAGWNLQTLTKGSSTGAATLAGLPFSTANAMGGCLGYTEKLTSITYPGFYINIGNPTAMNLLVDGAANSMTDTNFVVGANYIRGSFTYNT